MSGLDQYMTYRNATDQIRERVEQTQRSAVVARRRRHPGRQALARRLHTLADRLDG